MASSRSITILVHEWVTGGGLAGLEVRPSWLVEGRAIRRAVAADVLEINPRPMTSYVGLNRLMPPGHLARAWLAACGVPGFPDTGLAGLTEAIGRQPCIGFDAAGNVWQPDEELPF